MMNSNLLCRIFAMAVVSLAATMASGQIPTENKHRLSEGWEFIRQDMGSVWETVRPVPGAGKPEAVPLWESVNLPHCYNAQDAVNPYTNYYQGPAWYRTVISVDNPYDNGRILLEFEGSGQKTDVYIYTAKVDSHTGGYDGWCVDITDAVKDFQTDPELNARFKGKVPLEIRCDNSRDTEMIPSDMSDFNLYGGLYRNVNLVYVPSTYLSFMRIDTSLDDKRKTGRVEVSLDWEDYDRKKSADVTAYAEFIAPDGTAERQKYVNPGKGFTHCIKRPALWSADSPDLYILRLTIVNGCDTVTTSRKFGFRDIRFEEKGPFYLNGKRTLLRGTHRHEDHAGVGSAMIDEMMLHDMIQIKEMGANFIRLGHYQQSDRILQLCDSLGIMVWEEIPWCRGGVGGDLYRKQGRRMLRNMIEQHASHPSVIMWGMGNENDWPGDFDTFNKDEIRKYMKELNDISHELDPSRPTVIRRCDFCKDIVDVYSPSIWAGWYGRRFKDYAEMEKNGFDGTDRFFHAEWGGDSHAGRHAEETFQNGKSSFDIDAADRNGDWSESYIVRLFDWHLKEHEKMDWLTGSAFWTFKDFSTPLRPKNPIPYVNQKGVVERDNTPKESYYVFQSYWSTEPMVHIYGHSWDTRWGKADELKEVLVYSNCPEVELFVNGKSMGKRKRDSQDFPAAGLRWNVALRSGENEIEAVATSGKKQLSDRVLQQYVTHEWGKPERINLSLIEENGETMVVAELVDKNGQRCLDSSYFIEFGCTDPDGLLQNMGTSTGSQLIQAANGKARIIVKQRRGGEVVSARTPDLPLIRPAFLEL